MGAPVRRIHTVSGTIPVPRATIPTTPTLTHRLARQLAERWNAGEDYTALADAAIDLIVHELRTRPLDQLDARLADALEDAWAFELPEADADAAAECAVYEVPGQQTIGFEEATPVRAHRLAVGK